jgi:hypothetical protein
MSPVAAHEEDSERERRTEAQGESVMHAHEDPDRASGEPQEDGEDGLEPGHGYRSGTCGRPNQPSAVSKSADVEVEAREDEADGGGEFPYPGGVVGRRSHENCTDENAQPDQGDRDDVAASSHVSHATVCGSPE